MGIVRRSFGLILAMALVIAGLPMTHVSAHAMPQAAAPTPQVSAASATHHCDDMAMDDMAVNEAGIETAAPADDHGGQSPAAVPCKCLNCSLCVTSAVPPVLRLAAPERRTMPVIYRIDANRLAGIALPIDPGIPIRVS